MSYLFILHPSGFQQVSHLNTSMGSVDTPNRFLLYALVLVSCFALAGCGTSSAGTPVVSPTATIVRSSTFPVRTPTSRLPLSTPTASDASVEEVTLRWNGALIADVDDVSEIVLRLKDTPGIIDGTGDEIQITIRYDPQRITAEKIQRILTDMGYPSRKP